MLQQLIALKIYKYEIFNMKTSEIPSLSSLYLLSIITLFIVFYFIALIFIQSFTALTLRLSTNIVAYDY